MTTQRRDVALSADEQVRRLAVAAADSARARREYDDAVAKQHPDLDAIAARLPLPREWQQLVASGWPLHRLRFRAEFWRSRHGGVVTTRWAAGKSPATAHGVYDARMGADVEEWHRCGCRAVGMTTPPGAPGVVAVLELDARGEFHSSDGLAVFLRARAARLGISLPRLSPDDARAHILELFPAAPATLTGGGGLHVFFRLPAGRRISPEFGPHWRILDGLFVVAPGSLHPSGRIYAPVPGRSIAAATWPDLPEVPPEYVSPAEQSVAKRKYRFPLSVSRQDSKAAGCEPEATPIYEFALLVDRGWRRAVDLRVLDAIGAPAARGVAARVAERGYLLGIRQGQGVPVICPNCAEHTTRDGPTSTAIIYTPPPGAGLICCQHAHCLDLTAGEILTRARRSWLAPLLVYELLDCDEVARAKELLGKAVRAVANAAAAADAAEVIRFMARLNSPELAKRGTARAWQLTVRATRIRRRV